MVSLVAGLVAMAFAALVMWLPRWPGTVLLGVGLIAFLLVLRRNPAYWFRRMAAAAFGAAVSTGVVPNLDVGIQLAPESFGRLVVASGPVVPVAFVLLTAVFAVLDHLQHGSRPAGDTRRPRQASVVTHGPTGPAAGGDQVIQAPHSTYVEGAADAETLKKIVDRFDRDVAERDERLQGFETALAEKDQLIEQLRAALNRAAADAAKGDAAAQSAIDEARASGDVSQLQGVLIAEADRLGERVKEAAAEYMALCREIAAIAYVRGDIDEATKRLKAVLNLAPDDLDATNRLGIIHMLRGELPEAEQCYGKVLQLAGDDAAGQAVAYGNLGLIYQTRGDLDQAEQMLRKALEIEERLGRLEGMAGQYGNLGLIYRTRGDLDQAEQMHRKSLEIEERLGRLEGMAGQYGNLGLIYHTRGDLDQAEQMHRKSLELNERLGLLEGMANQYGNLGVVYETRGDLEQARKLWTKARDLFARIGMPHMVDQVQGWIDGLPGPKDEDQPRRPIA
ncbi:MAG: tetratricopeptide repeat protein [Planctomycetota bacterium]